MAYSRFRNPGFDSLSGTWLRASEWLEWLFRCLFSNRHERTVSKPGLPTCDDLVALVKVPENLKPVWSSRTELHQHLFRFPFADSKDFVHSSKSHQSFQRQNPSLICRSNHHFGFGKAAMP